jgi:oligopeptide transport system ATP-binding protein
MHDYSVDKPEWVEILPGHFVYGNTREMDGYRRELAAM